MAGIPQRNQLSPRVLTLLERARVTGLQFERPAHLVDKAMFSLVPERGRGKFVPYLSSFYHHLRTNGLADQVTRIKGRNRFQIRLRDPCLPEDTSIIFHAPRMDPGAAWNWYLSVDLNGHVLLRRDLGFPVPRKSQSRSDPNKRNALPIDYLRTLEAPGNIEDQEDLVWPIARLFNVHLSSAATWFSAELSAAAMAVKRHYGWAPSRPLTPSDIKVRLVNCEVSIDYLQERVPVPITDLLEVARKVLPGWSVDKRLGHQGGVARTLACHVVGLYGWAAGRVLREDQRLRKLGWAWDFTSTLAAYTTLDRLWQLARKRGAPVVPLLVWAALFDDADVLDPDLLDLVGHRFRRHRKQARDLLRLAARGPVQTGEPRRPKGTPARAKPLLDDKTKAAVEVLQENRVVRRIGKFHLGLDRLRALQEARRRIAS